MKQQNEKREYIRPELIQLDMGVIVASGEGTYIDTDTDDDKGGAFGGED